MFFDNYFTKTLLSYLSLDKTKPLQSMKKEDKEYSITKTPEHLLKTDLLM